MRYLSLHTACALALLSLALGCWSSVWAAGPEAKSVFPAGGQRGATVPVEGGGDFPQWPVQAWVDRPGVTLSATSEKRNFSAVIAPDAAPGLYWIRLYDPAGVSPPLPFIVGTLAEVSEQEPNDQPRKAQLLSSSAVVVNGQLGVSGDVDLFAVALHKGQTLVASLEAHETLGSPCDAAMQIVASRGNVLSFNHDERGLDPRIVFTAPADDTYFVRVFAFPSVPNSTITFAGSSQYIYRLTVTTGGLVDYAWPLAVTRSRESRVELIGWNLPETLKSVAVHPAGEQAEIFDPQLGNVATVAAEPHATIIEVEPNETATPQAIELPVTVTGRIDMPRDVDVSSFVGTKGEALVFQLESRALGYPLDAVLEVSDAAGKSLVRVDDAGSLRDPLLAFTPPADGGYRIAVSDLNRQGSSRHVYRLRAVKAPADFEITADAPAYTLVPGKPTEITLAIDRRYGFAEEISLRVTGLPEGITAAAAQSAAVGDSAKTVKVSLNTSGVVFSGPIRIVGEANGASKYAHDAGATIPGHTARIKDLWITATAAPKP